MNFSGYQYIDIKLYSPFITVSENNMKDIGHYIELKKAQLKFWEIYGDSYEKNQVAVRNYE